MSPRLELRTRCTGPSSGSPAGGRVGPVELHVMGGAVYGLEAEVAVPGSDARVLDLTADGSLGAAARNTIWRLAAATGQPTIGRIAPTPTRAVVAASRSLERRTRIGGAGSPAVDVGVHRRSPSTTSPASGRASSAEACTTTGARAAACSGRRATRADRCSGHPGRRRAPITTRSDGKDGSNERCGNQVPLHDDVVFRGYAPNSTGIQVVRPYIRCSTGAGPNSHRRCPRIHKLLRCSTPGTAFRRSR